jgi:phage shock protein A
MPDEPIATRDAARPDSGYDPDPGSTPDPGYDGSGVPTFDSVRDKIESRYATSVGAAELGAETPEGQSVEEQYEERQRKGAERLAQIRESMRSQEG